MPNQLKTCYGPLGTNSVHWLKQIQKLMLFKIIKQKIAAGVVHPAYNTYVKYRNEKLYGWQFLDWFTKVKMK